MKTINGRYELLEQVNTNAYGKVYKVFDHIDLKLYKLNILNRSIDQNFVDNFAKLFYGYTKINHPNIVRDYRFDIVDDDEIAGRSYFYLREYVDKNACIDYTKLSFQERLVVLEKIIYALKYIHFKNVSYNYLIFSNINIYKLKDGSIDVKLDDFANIYKSLSSIYKSGNPESKLISADAGTGNIAADVFSLANVAYYLITGKDVTFERVALELDIKDKYPKLYEQMILAIGPYEYRPNTIDGIWQACVEELGISDEFWDKEYYNKINFQVDLIAQQEQMQILENIVTNFYYGIANTSTVFVRSGLGIGKTRFLQELNYKLSIRGLNPVYCDNLACHTEKEEYAYFSTIIYKLLDKFKVSDDFIKNYGNEIIGVVPELAKKWNIDIDKQPEKNIGSEKTTSIILRLISEIASKNKFIIIIDDVDKMHSSDLNILYYLMMNIDSKRPFLILSINDMPLGYEKYKFEIEPEHIELSNFNHHHTVEYLKQILFVETVEAKKLARIIYPFVHGNPRNIESVISYLVSNAYIYISDERKYIIRDFDLNEIIVSDEIDVFREKYISLSDNARFLAGIFAIYAHKFDLFLARDLSGLTKRELNRALAELLQKNILREVNTISGKFYDFFDYKILALMYNNLDEKQKVEYHDKCRLYYEDLGELKDIEFDSYIFHLINANHRIEAVNKMLAKCHESYEANQYYESLDYLGFAKSIDIEDVECKLKLLVEESKTTEEIGDSNDAIKIYEEILSLAKDKKLLRYRFYALTKICDINLTMRKITEFQSLYSELLQFLKQIDKLSFDDEIEIKILHLRYLSLRDEPFELKEKSEELIKIVNVKEFPKFYYIAKYYLAISHYQIGDFDSASQLLKNLIKSIDSDKYPRQLIMCYSLIGDINHYTLYNDRVAYSYLAKARKLVVENKLERQNCRMFHTLARVSYNLGMIQYSLEKYIIAEKIALYTNQYDALFMILNDSIEMLISIGEYQLAENKNARFEQLSQKENVDVPIGQYYYNILLRAQIYLIYRMFDKIVPLFEQIEMEGLAYFNFNQRVKYLLINFKCNYLMKFYGIGDYDLDELFRIETIIVDPSERKIYRNFILELIIHVYALGDYELCDRLNELIEIANDNTNYESKDIKYEFINILNTSMDLKALKLLIIKASYETFSSIWKLYYIVTILEMKNANYIDAIFFCIEAVNKYWDRVSKFPESGKLHNIENDLLFNKLIDDFNFLRCEVYNLKAETALNFYVHGDDKLRTSMIKDQSIMNIIGLFYIAFNKVYFPSIDDYIKMIDDDPEKNIENMLLAFTHITHSEKSYILIVDEDGNKVQTFSSMGDEPPSEFDMYIEDIRKSEDYIYIKKNTDIDTGNSTNISYNKLAYNQNNKNILVFPICKREYAKFEFNRKIDSYMQSKENIVAYIYLESSLALSELNLAKLTHIRTYDGLNTLIINNYNMYLKLSLDKLTGVFIRSVVEKHVENIIKRMGVNYNFSVFMMDIDKFKSVNDTYGHRRGDKVLSRLGKILKKSLRKEDVVGRYGGEEFIAVINNTDSESAYKIADKLRVAVQKAKLLDQDGDLTISIGVSTYPIDGENFARLVENADKALYASKRNGRNKVTVYTDTITKLKHKGTDFTSLFSTDTQENIGRVKSILEMSSLLVQDIAKDEKIDKILEMILDVIDGKDILLLFDDDKDICVTKQMGRTEEYELEQNFRANIVSAIKGYSFVDWKNSNALDKQKRMAAFTLKRDWSSYVFVKVINKGETLATLLARSPLEVKEYSYKDYNYLLSVAPILAKILDE